VVGLEVEAHHRRRRGAGLDQVAADVDAAAGAGGTGKTSIIGYLQKYLNIPFLYLAPTHAATLELATATAKTGNKNFPSTVRSSIYYDKNDKAKLTTKAKRSLILNLHQKM
jgi:hypothetical protein